MNKKNEILELRSQGKMYHEIAKELNVAKSTVSYHCGKTTKTKQQIKQTARRKRIILDLKIKHGGKCQVCGYDKYMGALDFHHKNPLTKTKGIGELVANASLKTLETEAAKCLLLCANCHREVHGGLLLV